MNSTTIVMNDLQMDNKKIEQEITPINRKNSRQQQLRFAEEESKGEEDKQEKSPPAVKPPGRASRFLSIASGSPSFRALGTSLIKLRRLHGTKKRGSLFPEDISDELLDTIPFKIVIIPDRRDDFDMSKSALEKRREKNKEPIEIPNVLSSSLSEERRLEIIEEILKDLSHINILDEVRRNNGIPYQLPKKTQIQKNVANRIRDLTGSEIIMLNDQLYIKDLCKRLDEKHKEELEANFKRLATNDKTSMFI